MEHHIQGRAYVLPGADIAHTSGGAFGLEKPGPILYMFPGQLQGCGTKLESIHHVHSRHGPARSRELATHKGTG